MSKVVIGVIVTKCMGGMTTWVTMGVSFSVTWEAKVGIVAKTMLSSVAWETMVSAMTEAVFKSMSMESKICVVVTMSKAKVIMVVSMSIPVIETVWCSMWEAVIKTVVETMSIMSKTVVETMSIMAKAVSIVAVMVTPSISVVTVSVEVSISVVQWSCGVASWVVVLLIITVDAESMFMSSDFRWDVVDMLWEFVVIMSHMVVIAMSI